MVSQKQSLTISDLSRVLACVVDALDSNKFILLWNVQIIKKVLSKRTM